MTDPRRAGIRRQIAGRLQRCIFEALEPRHLLSVNVLTWHNDLTRQGQNNAEVILTPANVNSSTFGKLRSYPVSGQIYGQPLYVSNLALPGNGTHNVVFVVTQHDDVYAFDADSTAVNGGLLWHDSLGSPAATPNNVFANRYGPYHDINPQVGITSTPVIDLASGTMYIDAFTNDNIAAGINSTAYSHHIWALDLATGNQKQPPVLVVAAVPGNSAGSVNGTLTFTAAQQLQRSALTLFNGTLYVAYTGFADTNPYHGWILGFNAATLALTRVFNTTPTLDTDPAAEAGEGGIWQTGNGLSSDGTNLYLEIANGDFNAAATSSDWGDSFLKLAETDPAVSNLNGSGLSVTDYFTPFNEQALADADQDLGSGGTLILPDQSGAHPHEIVGSGKGGIIYVVDRDNMGTHTTTIDRVVQKVSLGHGVFSSPAYFNGDLYYHAVGDVLKAFSVSGGTLSSVPVASGGVTYSSWGATPSVSSNGNANGIVWDLEFSTTHEVLHAYDAASLTQLYNSNQVIARDQLAVGVKFVTPTIADGKVIVGTDGALVIYGLLAPPTTPPAAPSSLAATGNTANQIKLTWTDNADNESGSKIERSTDGINFSQIALASANATAFADQTVTAGVTYTYRIRATNVIGDSAFSGTASATAIAASVALDRYPFEEGSGVTTADIAGTNNGTLIGGTLPQWTAGRIGNDALSFTGDGVVKSLTVQSSVQLANDLAPVLGNTATLTAWIKTTQLGNNTPTSAPAITGVEAAGSTNDIRWGYLDATGHIGISAGNNTFPSTSVISDGNWHHVAFTRDVSTGFVQVFVDGVLQTTGFGDTGAKTSPFRLIGAQTDISSAGTASGATYLNAVLDDVRVYNQVLTAGEIASMGAVPAPPANLTATAMSGSIVQLQWANLSSFAQNIEVDRRTATSGGYAQVALLAGNATLYNDVGLTAGTQYFYKLRAADAAGSSAFTAEVSATPPQPAIIGRYTFYNNSIFDGQNGSSNVADDRALAPDKTALLPAQTATFANYTSYAAGLNGILIDFTNLQNVPSISDFTFRVGNDNNPDLWPAAPAPDFVTTYPGRGAGGSVRLELLWPDNEIHNQWLQVTVHNDGAINMAAPDVFYFGNAIGEAGDDPASARVDAIDQLAPRPVLGGTAGSAGLASPYDYNRDGVVDDGDLLIARTHVTWAGNQLQLISPPLPPPPPSVAAAIGVAPEAGAAPQAAAPTLLLEPAPALRPLTPQFSLTPLLQIATPAPATILPAVFHTLAAATPALPLVPVILSHLSSAIVGHPFAPIPPSKPHPHDLRLPTIKPRPQLFEPLQQQTALVHLDLSRFTR